MARIRTIKPGFFSSLSIAELPIPTRLTFIGLWTYVDDEGRGVDDARLIKAALWPLDDNYTTKKVEADLVMLATKGRIVRYEHGGRRYLAVVKSSWKEHQRIDKPQDSILPDVEDSTIVQGGFRDDSGTIPGTVPESSENTPARKGRERKGKESCTSPLPQNLGVASPGREEEEILDRLEADTEAQLAIGSTAERRLAIRSEPLPGGIRRREWLKTVSRDVALEFGHQILAWRSHGLDGRTIADLIEPPPPAAYGPKPPPRFELDEHGAAVLVEGA